jgi:copper chaperone CopZ
VRVAVQKLEGVESVEVSLERASATVQLRAGNAVSLAQLREIIKNNGFTAKEAVVTVVGTLIERGGAPALETTGTKTVMLLVRDSKQPGAFEELQQAIRSASGPVVEVSGLVESRRDEPDRVVVRAFRRVERAAGIK